MKPSSAGESQHIINLWVLLVSAAAAWLAPLQTFLIAYAVIGPFHYLTEIAWLRKKDFYFSDGVISSRVYVFISFVLCGVACLDFYFRRGWGTYAIVALIVLSLGALVKNVPVLLGAFALLVATRFLVHGYGLFFAAFVPTVVHVYVFTLIFLVAGAMRTQGQRALAWLNPALLLLIPVLLIRPGSSAGPAMPGHYWMASEVTFAGLHEYIAGWIGLAMHFDPNHALEPNAVAALRFLAFIYLHHYLNWFAKTEVLAWHKVSRSSWIVIGAIYTAAIGSYAYSFALGFYAAYFLSLLHVLLELPLDWRSGAGILNRPWQTWQARMQAGGSNASSAEV